MQLGHLYPDPVDDMPTKSDAEKDRVKSYFGHHWKDKTAEEWHAAYEWFQEEVAKMIASEEAVIPIMATGWRRHRDLQARCEIAAGGYAPAGRVLAHLLKRWRGNIALKKDKDGPWVAQTATVWCHELNLSAARYKRAVRVLKNAKLCEFTTRPFGQLLRVGQIRPTANAFVLMECFYKATESTKGHTVKLVNKVVKNAHG